jgi:hypothetical protein
MLWVVGCRTNRRLKLAIARHYVKSIWLAPWVAKIKRFFNTRCSSKERKKYGLKKLKKLHNSQRNDNLFKRKSILLSLLFPFEVDILTLKPKGDKLIFNFFKKYNFISFIESNESRYSNL